MTKAANAKNWGPDLHDWSDGTTRSFPEPDEPSSPLDLPGIFAWAFAGDSGENIVSNTGGGTPKITELTNLADENNNFTNDTGDGQPAMQAGFTASGYTTSKYPLALEQYADTTQAGRQGMSQATSLGATGEFYCAFATLNTRIAGDRYILGTEGGDYIRLNQEDNHISIAFGGSETEISADQTVPVRAVVEVWRDSSDNIHCWVNGSDVTSGTPNNGATWNLNGYGGGDTTGSSALDDYFLEFFVCGALPDADDRAWAREYLDTHWSLGVVD